MSKWAKAKLKESSPQVLNSMTDPFEEPSARVVLRPLATPLPLGFLALVLATTTFAALQLGWIPPEQGRVAAITAVAATVPLQLLASVVGFLARDPVAATGMGVLTGTWARRRTDDVHVAAGLHERRVGRACS